MAPFKRPAELDDEERHTLHVVPLSDALASLDRLSAAHRIMHKAAFPLFASAFGLGAWSVVMLDQSSYTERQLVVVFLLLYGLLGLATYRVKQLGVEVENLAQ